MAATNYFIQRIWGLFSNPGNSLIGITDSVNPPSFLTPVSGQNILPSGDTTGTLDTAVIVNAISNVATIGGGTVTLAPGQWYITAGSIVLTSNVVIVGYGATLNLVGSGVHINTPSTGVVSQAGLVGLKLQGGSTYTTQLQLASCYNCIFKDLYLLGNNPSGIVIALSCNTSGPTNTDGNYNLAFCLFENIYQDSSSTGCGTFLQLRGNDNSHVVTDNTFVNINSRLVNNIGIDFQQWCDSNIFVGMIRINLNGGISPANGVGCIVNSASPAVNNGVYCENFQHLAVDTFGAPGTDNRVGIALNLSKLIMVQMMEFGPDVPNNVIGGNGQCLSYIINQAPKGGGNYFGSAFVGSNLGVGAAPVANIGVNIQGAQTSGATQYGLQALVGPLAASGCTLAAAFAGQSTPVAGNTLTFAMGFYAPGNVLTGSTAVNNYGFYSADQTGGTNNYGFFSNVSAGAGKFGFNAAGTAANQFAGPTAVGGTITSDSAAAGYVGEFIQSDIGSGSAISLTTATQTNVTSISLTAGDWDVWGQVAFLPAGTTTVTFLAGATSTTSAVLGALDSQCSQMEFVSFTPGAVGLTQTPPQRRLSLSAPTTVYLVAQANFATSTMSAYGSITARRRR